MNDFANYCKNRIKYGFFKFLLFLIIASVLFFIFDKSVVKADEVIFESVGYLTDKTTIVLSDLSVAQKINSGTSYTVSDVNSIQLYINDNIFNANTTYRLEISTPNGKLQSIDNVSIVSDDDTVCTFGGLSDTSIGYPKILFSCPTEVDNLIISLTNSSNSNIVSTTSFRWNYIYLTKQTSSSGLDTEILENQNQQIIDQNNQNIDQNTEIIDQNNQIIQGQDEIKDTIKDTFEDCTDSVNLFRLPDNQTINGVSFTKNDDGTFNLKGTVSASTDFSVYVDLLTSGIGLGKTYTLSTNTTGFRIQVVTYSDDTWISTPFNRTSDSDITKITSIMSTNSSINRIRYMISVESGTTINLSNIEVQLEEGSSATAFEPFGQEICSNKLDQTNDTLKGGFSSIGNWFTELGNKIGNFFDNLLTGILDGLKNLFIPEEGYFEEWFNDIKSFFEEKLGFLATPFTLVIQFINRYLELYSNPEIIIKIPDITVPNFENHKIISATTLNWSELLESKESLKTLWELYLSFIDVFLILNFINLCENKYNRIFGGDTTNYEYYTVEERYNVDNNTGEVTNYRRKEKTSTRKKVEG